MNYKSTADAIREAANELEYRAKELRRYAEDIEKKQDFEYVASALNCFANLFQNVRLDLFAARPIRELTRKSETTK
jgi:hypothetical protein